MQNNRRDKTHRWVVIDYISLWHKEMTAGWWERESERSQGLEDMTSSCALGEFHVDRTSWAVAWIWPCLWGTPTLLSVKTAGKLRLGRNILLWKAFETVYIFWILFINNVLRFQDVQCLGLQNPMLSSTKCQYVWACLLCHYPSKCIALK